MLVDSEKGEERKKYLFSKTKKKIGKKNILREIESLTAPRPLSLPILSLPPPCPPLLVFFLFSLFPDQSDIY